MDEGLGERGPTPIIFDTPAAYKTGQPSIGDEEEGHEAHDEIVDGGDEGPDPLKV